MAYGSTLGGSLTFLVETKWKGQRGLNQIRKKIDQIKVSEQGASKEALKFTSNVKIGTNKAVSGFVKMQRVAKTSFGATIRNMLSFQNMMTKIVHYITFSIGVQMVMMIRKAFMDMIDIFKRFESSVTNAAAVSGYLGKSFDTAREAISKLSIELARKTIFTATEVADAMYTVASAGIDPVRTGTEELIPILHYAAATQTDLKEATQYVITTLKQFKMGLEDTNIVVDTFTTLITNSFMTAEKMANAMQYMGQISGELNQDLREVASAATLLADRGYTGSQAGQRLNMIFTKLVKPTAKSERALARLGLTLEDIDPTAHSLVEILNKLKAANFGVSDAAQMFRARTAAAAATLVSAVEEVEEYVLISKQMQGITESIAEQQMKTMESGFKKLAGAAEELAIVFTDRLAESLGTLKTAIEKAGAALVDSLNIDVEGNEIWDFLTGPALQPLQDVFDQMDIAEAWKEGVEKLEGGPGLGAGLLEDFYRMDPIVIAFQQGPAAMMGATSIVSEAGPMKEYLDYTDEIIRIKDEMLEYQTDEEKNTERYMQLQMELVDIYEKLSAAEGDVLRGGSEIVQTILSMKGPLADTVSTYVNYAKEDSKLTQLELKRNSLLEQRTELQTKMNREREIGGTSSKEYIQFFNQWKSAGKDLLIVEEDIKSKTVEVAEVFDDYKTQYEDLDNAQKDYADTAKDILDLESKLLTANSEMEKVFVEYNRQLDISENREQYRAEALLDVYDLKDKLLKLELEAYKLDEEKNKLDEELFDQLAEQGLLTEEMIEYYKEWQEAEGDLMAAQAAYAAGEISKSELQTYINAAENAQTAFSNATMITAQEYMELGIASNAVATTVTNILDHQNDLEQITGETTSTTYALARAEQAVDDIAEVTVDTIKDANTEWLLAKQKVDAIYLSLAKFPDEKLIDLGLVPPDPSPEEQGKQMGLDWSLGFLDGIKSIVYLFYSLGKQIGQKILDGLKVIFPVGSPIRNLLSWIPGFSIGGIVGAQKGIEETRGPQLSMIGEKGPEAVIPLVGANRKYGQEILNHIIPKYYPEMMRQGGGVYGGGGGNTYNTAGNENYNITGPIHITAQNPQDFMNQMKLRYRASR